MSAPDSTPVVHGDEQTPPTPPADARKAERDALAHLIAHPTYMPDHGGEVDTNICSPCVRGLVSADAVLAAGYVREAVGPEVEITYRNYRGEVANRRVRPLRVWYGATPWHPEPQWLLDVVDAEKGLRSFALGDVIDFGGRGSVSGGGNATEGNTT